MAEAITITGEIQAASLLQTINWLGQTFTITRSTAGSYNPTTGIATPTATIITVKGIVDDSRQYTFSESATPVRINEKSIIIPTKDTSGNFLSFIPGAGDLVTSNSLNDSIARTETLQAFQGVVAFYRLVMETA